MFVCSSVKGAAFGNLISLSHLKYFLNRVVNSYIQILLTSSDMTIAPCMVLGLLASYGPEPSAGNALLLSRLSDTSAMTLVLPGTMAVSPLAGMKQPTPTVSYKQQ